jgi:hypothetical protein
LILILFGVILRTATEKEVTKEIKFLTTYLKGEISMRILHYETSEIHTVVKKPLI